MAEYIGRGTAISKLTALEVIEPASTLADARRLLAEMPGADVAPVVPGRWEHLGGDEWCCSACGFVITTEGSWDKPTKKYCEDCGGQDGRRC